MYKRQANRHIQRLGKLPELLNKGAVPRDSLPPKLLRIRAHMVAVAPHFRKQRQIRAHRLGLPAICHPFFRIEMCIRDRLEGDLGAIEDDDVAAAENSRSRVLDLVLPVVCLIVLCVLGMVYVGGLFQGAGFIDAFANTDASVGLPWGALIALILTIVYLVARRVMTFKEAMACIPKGFIAMVPAILILTFALTLKGMTGLLGADEYVAGLMKQMCIRDRDLRVS